MKYVCKTKCYHNNRLWDPGEELVVPEGSSVPKHFIPAQGYKAPAPPKPVEPIALSQLPLHSAKATIARAANKSVEELDDFLK